MQYTFIVNPNSRSGKGRKEWSVIEDILKEHQVDYRVFFTSRRNHATRIVRSVMEEEAGDMTFIVLGGDGTLNEVITGITDFSRVTLGYIPIGSSNDFARGMHLTKNYRKALAHILHPASYVDLNVGVAHFQEKERRFIVSSGIGYDAGICHQVLVSKLKVFFNRFHLGKLSYPAVGIERLIKLNPKPMTLSMDRGAPVTFPHTYFIAAFNTPYEGGGFKFCPDADPTDGMLDIIVVAGIPKLKALLLFPVALFGKHRGISGIYLYRCRRADIVSAAALPVHTDGEPVFLKRQLSFTLEPDNLRFILS